MKSTASRTTRRGGRQRGLILLACLCALVLAGVFVVNNTLGRADCAAEWQRTGMNYEFMWWSGCMVEAKPDVWIPAKDYRRE